ncbi:MAG: hypothetical protein KKC19_00495 [Nanoarchaeota archaeon]|nr:hypothetical protein [Nanoarchaeota archaeon]
MKAKPEFKGKLLIEITKEISQIGFLEGDFGESFYEEFKGRARKDYKGNSNLNILDYEEYAVKGSNPFAVVLANQILNEENLRVANQTDLEKAMKLGVLDLRRTYEDTGLVLRSEEDDSQRNILLSKNMVSQLRERRTEFSSENPVMIPLTQLTLEKTDSDYGLTFKLKDDAMVYNAPVLARDGCFNSKNIDEETGLPIKLGDGNRILYTRDTDLSRFCLYWGSVLSSDDRNLGDSYEYGRMVIVKD